MCVFKHFLTQWLGLHICSKYGSYWQINDGAQAHIKFRNFTLRGTFPYTIMHKLEIKTVKRIGQFN